MSGAQKRRPIAAEIIGGAQKRLRRRERLWQ